jgi:hypothetical protein
VITVRRSEADSNALTGVLNFVLLILELNTFAFSSPGTSNKIFRDSITDE